jgi:hypothetical protein
LDVGEEKSDSASRPGGHPASLCVRHYDINNPF